MFGNIVVSLTFFNACNMFITPHRECADRPTYILLTARAGYKVDDKSGLAGQKMFHLVFLSSRTGGESFSFFLS